MNHTADEYYSKHGYPPWMKHKVNYNAGTTEEDRDHENERGKHIFNDAVNEKNFKAINPEQLQHLLDMIQNSKGTEKVVNNTIGDFPTVDNNTGRKGMNCWILDTGATDHVTCSISVYTNYYKIKPAMVKLPNNQRVTVFFAGTVYLTQRYYTA